MQISAKTTLRTPKPGAYEFHWTGLLALTMFSVALCGCASPGPPLPPTLNLPQIPAAKGLSVQRTGVTVTVRWATPERTTDKLLIKGNVEAEICRELAASATQRPEVRGAGPQSGSATRSATVERSCSPVVAKVSAQPGAAGEAVDVLPAELASGPPRLLAYRVQLKNAAGRTAGASSEIFAATGGAPSPLAGFRARNAKGGVVLEWTTASGPSGDRVELERTDAQASESKPAKSKDPIDALSAPKQPNEIRLRAGEGDAANPGGTVDRSVELGHTYSYTAWRVRTVQVGGQQLEVRSAVSPAVAVKVEDSFAPDAPSGLVAVPALAGEGAQARPAIDLSWEPNDEPRVQGYRVYRSDGATGAWRLISGAQSIAIAAYRDATVAAGQRYVYRVTAVGLNGMESSPSAETTETAATP